MILIYIAFFFFLFLGFGFGAFAAAQIIYPIFHSLPILWRWKKEHRIVKVPYYFTLTTPVIWIGAMVAVAWLVSSLTQQLMAFLIGFAISTFMIIGQIHNPNNTKDMMETYSRYLKKHPSI